MQKSLLLIIYSVIFTLFTLPSFAAEIQARRARVSLKQECEANRSLVVANYFKNKRYEVKCEDNYHLYNAKSAARYYNKKTVVSGGEVKLLSFNLFHPGKSNTRYKDYKIIAAIMNKYDLVSGLELLGSLGSANQINANVLSEISRLKAFRGQMEVTKKSISTTVDLLEGFNLGIQFVSNKVLELAKVYKKPGYLKIFEELQKLDPSWTLIISAQGEEGKAGKVQELVGFYFKAKKVKLLTNQYCKSIYSTSSGTPYACTPQFGKKFLGVDAGFVFSRRPFIANFEAGNFDFTMLASHVVFRTPKQTEKINKILKVAFGLNRIEDLKGSGANLSTYSRFAEVKLTMDLMKKMKKVYAEKNLIFTGDFNLEAQNKFWSNSVMNMGPDLKLLVTEKTTLAKKAYLKDSTPTNGYSSNYDHFLLDINATSECDVKSAKRFDFIAEESIKTIIDDKYIVRDEELVAGILYLINSNAENIIADRTAEFEKKLKEDKKIANHKIVPRYSKKEIDLILFNYHRRVFESQMVNESYYRVYAEIISDHVPVSMSCSTDSVDRDRRR